jgi:hypothetical protein
LAISWSSPSHGNISGRSRCLRSLPDVDKRSTAEDRSRPITTEELVQRIQKKHTLFASRLLPIFAASQIVQTPTIPNSEN